MVSNTSELFERTVPQLIASDPQRFKLGVAFAVDVADVGTWTINLRLPSIVAGVAGRVDLTLKLAELHLSELIANPDKGMDLYYRGDLKVDGDLTLAPQVLTFMRMIGGRAGAAKSGLDIIVNPMPAGQFLSEHWPGKPLYQHGAVERLEGLTDIPELHDVDSLLNAWKGLVAVFPSKLGDEQDAPSVPPEQAAELWKRGFALVFNAVHLSVPRLVPVLRSLQSDLGLPSITNARCIVYATPHDAGAKPHFDQNVNFIVQLRGEKIWKLAPNPAITNPTTRHVMGADVSPELQMQATQPFIKEMPADAETIRLRRGSVLFLPRAWWHSTVAGESGLALNFTFSQPSWADVMAEAVRRRLSLHPKWRELARGAGSANPAVAKEANERLGSLLDRFVNDLGALSASSITSGFGGPSRDSAMVVDLKRDWVATLTQDPKNAEPKH